MPPGTKDADQGTSRNEPSPFAYHPSPMTHRPLVLCPGGVFPKRSIMYNDVAMARLMTDFILDLETQR